MRVLSGTCRPLSVLQACAAVAAMLVGGAGPAVGQPYYEWTGGVSAVPTDANEPNFVVSGSLLVGDGADGSFSALAGSNLTADQLAFGNGGTWVGTMTVTGPSTFVSVVASMGTRMDVGGWGTGTLDVSGGAKVDAASAPCSDGGCYTFIGNAAGSTGTLNVSGAGSEVRTLSFIVGQSSVFTFDSSGFDFGTRGGTTNGFVNVLAGGTLRTERATVGYNNRGPDGNGEETATGTATVSGSGTQWILTHDSLSSQAANLTIGLDPGGTGNVTVNNGGKLHVDGSAAAGQSDVINIGVDGGKGTLVVTGTGSALEMAGYSGVIQVGLGAGGDGTFQVLAGASADAVFLNLGLHSSSTGTVLIDGTGSRLTLSGQGNYAGGGTGPAFTIIGWEGAGEVTVSNSAVLRITDGYDTSGTPNRPPGFIVGFSSGSVGSLNVGSGGTFEVISTSITPETGNPDNFNAVGYIGLSPGSEGTVNITSGGKLRITGEALSTAAHPRGTNLFIGGSSDTAGGGKGTVNVTGPGSELRVAGADAFIAVGRNGNGTLDLKGQAKVVVEGGGMNVGRGASGVGSLKLDNSSIELSGQHTSSAIGAFLTLGNRGGSGTATLGNGSVVTIQNMGPAGASLNLGGTGLNPLGTGELTLQGGSRIEVITASGLATVSVGHDGTGTAMLQGASRIDLGDGTLYVGRLATGSGTVTIETGSKVLTGIANIGGSTESTAGGTGVVTVQGAGSELAASGSIAFIGVGRRGNGSLTVSDQGKVSGIAMSVGRGAGGDGKLVVDGASIVMSGQQTAGNLVGANLAIGLGGGIGDVKVKNGSTVVIDNAGSNGANLLLGGSTTFPTGTGTLELSGGSRIDILGQAAAGPGALGKAALTIGNDNGGSGTLTMSGASAINVGSGTAGANGAPPVGFQRDGAVYVARQPGSVGELNVTEGSTINAGFVGVGVSAAGTGQSIGAPGGTGVLVLADGSKINAPRFELGAGSTLAGNGDINAGPDGQVVIAGTISPGFSPGRIRIYCDVRMLDGSQLVIEVDPGDGGVDQLVLGTDSTFDLKPLQIVFDFGAANPEDVTLDLNEYLRVGTPDSDETQSLAGLFGEDQDWNDFVDTELFAFQSSAYDVTGFEFNPVTGRITDIQAVAVPEPATLALVLAALVLMARQRRRAIARR